MAPETLKEGELSFKADIYSLGRVVLNLLVAQNNYDIETVRKIYPTIVDIHEQAEHEYAVFLLYFNFS
jgi:hypothetical protein